MSQATGKDAWDKVQALGTLLSGVAIPLILFVATQKAEQLQKASARSALERERVANESARARELEIAEISARVSQASVIPPLIDGLLSTDPARRKLAISAILIALPEDGPRLVRELGVQDQSAEIRSYATNALQGRKDQLVADLFAGEADTRKTAARALVEGWRNDPELPKRIIDHADTHRDDATGVYNSVVVLSGLSSTALAANKDRVATFVQDAAKQGPQTATQADRVKAKLKPAPAPPY